MKKPLLLLIIGIVVIVIIVLLFPRRNIATDGGSYSYRALLYEITFYRGTEDPIAQEKYGDVSLYIFPCFNFYWSARD